MNQNDFNLGPSRLFALLRLGHAHDSLTSAKLQPARSAHCGVIASIAGDERVENLFVKLQTGGELVLTHAEWRGS